MLAKFMISPEIVEKPFRKKEIEKGLEFKGLVLGYAWSDLKKSLRQVLKN